jgi:hypothetical protein
MADMLNLYEFRPPYMRTERSLVPPRQLQWEACEKPRLQTNIKRN